MKRLLIVLMAILVLLPSCGRQEESKAAESSVTVSNTTNPTVVTTTTTTTAPTKQVAEATLSIDEKEFINNLRDDPKMERMEIHAGLTSNIDNYVVTTYRLSSIENLRIIFFKNKDNKIEAMSFIASDLINEFQTNIFEMIVESVLVTHTRIPNNTIDNIITNLKNGVSYKKDGYVVESLNNETDKHHYVIYAESNEDNLETYSASKTLPRDLLENEKEYNSIKTLIDTCNFADLLTKANEYLDENPDSKGNAYVIRNLLTSDESIIKYAESTIINYDEIEQKSYVYYPGVEEISANINFMTYLEDSRPIISAGFVAPDWLFFEDIIISCDGGDPIKININYFNVIRDVLGDGNIIEKTTLTLSKEEIQQIADANSVIIRFKSGETDEYLDFEISPEEQYAFRTMNVLRQMHVTLSDSITFPAYLEYYKGIE